MGLDLKEVMLLLFLYYREDVVSIIGFFFEFFKLVVNSINVYVYIDVIVLIFLGNIWMIKISCVVKYVLEGYVWGLE